MLQTPTTQTNLSLSDARLNEALSDWRLTPATLMSKLDPSWIPAKWLQYLSFKIAQTISRGSCGLLISAPPRHGKSMLSTIATPLWVLENFPHYNVVVATYGEELSTDFSRTIRDTIQNNQDILSVRLRKDTQRVTNFLTTKGGGLKAVGLRGAITGRGANVFVLDDYIKEPKEAMSASYLEDLWTWWLTVARTRLEPGAVVIILATRWVAKDLHGRIMQRQRETGRRFFEYVELPAIFEGTKFPDPGGATDDHGQPIMRVDPYSTDVLGRKVGEVLFSERYNQDSILDIKAELGTRWFNAMFQQKPDDEENAVASSKWFQRINLFTFNSMIAEAQAKGYTLKWGRYWDMASTAEAGDYTSGSLGVWIKETDRFLIRNIKRGQYSPAKAEAAFVRTTKKDYDIYAPYKVGMEQEPGSSGKYSIRHFEGLLKAKEEAIGGPPLNIKLHEFPATQKKMINAQPMLAAAEAGKVYILDDPENDPEYNAGDGGLGWVMDFLNEIDDFPEGANDDQMDSTSGLYRMLTGKKGITAAIGRSQAAQAATTSLREGNRGHLAQQHGPHANSGVLRRSRVTFGRG